MDSICDVLDTSQNKNLFPYPFVLTFLNTFHLRLVLEAVHTPPHLLVSAGSFT